MKREQFIYELIDNYLYYVNLNNIVMENYTCKERTAKSLNDAIEELDLCLDFYDQLSLNVKAGNVEEKFADVKLEYIITYLCNREKCQLINDIKKYSAQYVDDIELFLKENLLYDKKGKEQVISYKTIEKYMITLRKTEETRINTNIGKGKQNGQ